MIKDLLIKVSRWLRSSVARAIALSPGSSVSFGPPRRHATTTSIHDSSVLVRHSLIPTRATLRPVAELADPPLDRLMMHPEPARIKEIFVAELPQGRYWGRYHGYIIDRNDTLLTDLSLNAKSKDQRHDALDQFKLPPLREIRGTVAVIHTLFSENFHHWLLDTLPHFEWLLRAGWSFDKIDYFVLPPNLLRFHHETLKLLGIDESKVICSGHHLHIRADLLLVPCHSEPSAEPGEYDYTPEGLQFVRDLLLTNNPFMEKKYPRRIIVSRERASARRLVQAEKANAELFKDGFEKVLLEDHSLQEQAAMFNQAECVIMPTGGNLANFVFCRPGTIAMELFSISYLPTFTHAFMDEIGLRYYALVTHTISRPRPSVRTSNEDIDLDPDRLVSVVREALAKGNGSGSPLIS